MNSVFEHHRFMFSLRISSEFYALASQIRVFAEDCSMNSSFWRTMNSASWHPRLMFSQRIYIDFCVLAPQNQFSVIIFNQLCVLAPQIRVFAEDF